MCITRRCYTLKLTGPIYDIYILKYNKQEAKDRTRLALDGKNLHVKVRKNFFPKSGT